MVVTDAPAPATNFSFASFFQDNMVFQMQPYSAVLWGFGVVGATVNVTLGNDVYPAKVVENSNKKGVWKVTFKPQAPGGPHTIIATQVAAKVTSKLSLQNVLFGDVWVCGGQSNMEFTVSMVSVQRLNCFNARWMFALGYFECIMCAVHDKYQMCWFSKSLQVFCNNHLRLCKSACFLC